MLACTRGVAVFVFQITAIASRPYKHATIKASNIAVIAVTYQAVVPGWPRLLGSGRRGRHSGGTEDKPRVRTSTTATPTGHGHRTTYRMETV